MSRPVRIPLIVSALALLVGGCDILGDDDKKREDTAGDDMGADDMAADDEETGGDDETAGTDGGGGTGGNTGEPLTPCQQCAAVNCADETMPCAGDQVCQDCAFQDASDPACDENAAWQAALACACDVCPDACTDICG